IQPPSTTCLYIIPLKLASCCIALFDVALGFAVGIYGYYALTDKPVPKSRDDVMGKLTGIVFILLAFMIVVFSSVMFAGALLKKTDLVSPYIIVVGFMSACTALLSFTTGVAVNTDEKQRTEIAHQIYIWTLIIVVLQFFFIRTVNKYYKSIRDVGLPVDETIELNKCSQPTAESSQSCQPTDSNEPTSSGCKEALQSSKPEPGQANE
ncbi:hypothetical protein L9F63_012334, partial [Diploptera punctata]